MNDPHKHLYPYWRKQEADAIRHIRNLIIPPPVRVRKGGWVWLIAGVIAAVLLIRGCEGEAWAGAPISDYEAVLSIIGEAEGEGYRGMLAVAHAIRNRGTLRGVYGRNAKRVRAKLYTSVVYTLAKTAWRVSGIMPDITGGATHWENINAFGKPWWAKKMLRVAKIGSHTFYKEN